MRYSLRYLLLILLALTIWTGSANAQDGFGIQVVKLGSPIAEVGGFMNYSIFVSVNNPVGFCFDGEQYRC